MLKTLRAIRQRHQNNFTYTLARKVLTISLIQPVVAVVCSSPPPGDNTVSAPEELAVQYQGVYTYTCKFGYDTEDGVTTQCQADGSWSLEPPNCKCKLLLLLGVQL